MTTMEKMAWVALGAALGGVGRVFVVEWAVTRFDGIFPYGTLIVNVSGSFLLGVLVAYSVGRTPLSPVILAFLGAGFCGSFTTFSTFSVETFEITQQGMNGMAIANILLNNGLSFLSVLAGWWMGKI